MALLPFIKYPLNPPGVGDPETLLSRQLFQTLLFVLSVVATGAVLIALRKVNIGIPELSRRWGPYALVLLGYVAFTVNGRLRLDGVAVRRTVEGDITLSYPSRRDEAGREHPYILPVDDATHRELEQAVFDALGIEERVA